MSERSRAGRASSWLVVALLALSTLIVFVPTAAAACSNGYDFAFEKNASTEIEFKGDFSLKVVRTIANPVDPPCAGSVKWLTADNTAHGDDDFERVSSRTLFFGDGEEEKSISINIYNNDGGTDDRFEDFTVSLFDSQNGGIGPANTHKVTIEEDTGVFRFVEQSHNVNEPGGQDQIKKNICVDRIGESTLSATVEAHYDPGTASAGTDFHSGFITLAFTPGATRLCFDVTVLDDTSPELAETIVLSLQNVLPAGKGTLDATFSRGTITIHDDDGGGGNTGAAQVGFLLTQMQVTEGDPVQVIVQRTGETNLQFEVSYEIVPGTAQLAIDYLPPAQGSPLNFAQGETTKVLLIPTLDDNNNEDDETFIVRLLERTSGVTLGSSSTLSIVIVDNDGSAARAPGPGILLVLGMLGVAVVLRRR